MNKVNMKSALLATTITTGILYVVCAFLVALWPKQTVAFFGSWFHGIDITKIAGVPLSFSSFLLGLISLLIVVFVTTFVFVYLYNRLEEVNK